tara:strand:- start:824 stop:2794 length:1971 start_codon:yes stop_codon:yes gene_type:complete
MPHSEYGPTVVISNVWPTIEGGRYAIKRIPGEPIEVWADIFKDGHDVLDAVVKWRKRGVRVWEEQRMRFHENDRWFSKFELEDLGEWEFTIDAWMDEFKTWLHEYEKKFEARKADETLQTEITEGAIIVEDSAKIAEAAKCPKDAEILRGVASRIREADAKTAMNLVKNGEFRVLMHQWTNRSKSTSYQPFLRIRVERERARFSSWYEFFPRGAEGSATKHSKFRDCVERLRYAKNLGFDVAYFPPIHPIGETFRKGKDGKLYAEDGEPGSPWAIGSAAGGHYSTHPELGTVEDFEWLVNEAKKIDIEIALDFAINCSPDHPFVKTHPDWFFHRPDGTIKYAENPPKKYQDIYPLNFHCEDWKNLWAEMVNIVLFWIGRGVKIFRVDNPHTKPFAFWEYLIAQVQKKHPDVIFLAEAFTRPRMMEMLGKIGFSQSYSYFTWRTQKQELIDYAEELAHGPMKEYYRANFWPNTPDILVQPLVDGPPAAFKIRAALAATLMPSWGMYSGLEFCENQKHPDRDEYRDNEKFELKERDWNKSGNIKEFIRRLNHIRATNPAFHEYSNLVFCHTDNDHILAFAKRSSDGANAVIVVINLDPHVERKGSVNLPLDFLGLEGHAGGFRVKDVMYGETYDWIGAGNWVQLNPQSKPLHILQVQL